MQLVDERRKAILDTIERDGRALSVELARALNTSEDTIRRDLRDLDIAGLLRRVHGGAVKRIPGEPPLSERDKREPARRAALALAVSSLIEPSDTVLIDAGSTNLALARSLRDGCAAAIVTNSPQIALALDGFQRTRIVLIGGSYSPQCGAALGPQALAAIADMRPTIGFIGVCGLDPQQGLFGADFDEAQLKRSMFAACGRRVVMVLTERLQRSAPFAIAPLRELDVLAVEPDLPAATLQALRAGEPHLDIRIADLIG